MKCPYCSEVHIVVPKLDFDCSYCRKRVFVRVEPKTKITDYFTEAEVKKFDKLSDEMLRDGTLNNKFKKP